MTTVQSFFVHSSDDPAGVIARIESFSEKRFSQNGSGKMVWHVWGKGRPLVLLHGGFGSWLHWIRNIPEWMGRFSVYVPTMPGFGDSDDLPFPQTVENIASIVSAGIDEILPPREPFHLLGFSFGGVVGGFVAALQADRVLSFTLSGSGGMGLVRNSLEQPRNWRFAKTEDDCLKAHRKNLEILMFADPEQVDDLAVYIQNWNTQRCRVRVYKYRQQDILRGPLSKVKGHLMGIYGSRDPRFESRLSEQAGYLAAIQPHSIFKEVAGAGHWACYEDAENFNRTYLEMLQAVGV